MIHMRYLYIALAALLWLMTQLSGADPQPDNPGGGSGSTYFLSADTGDNTNDGLSKETAWATLQFAINNLQAGDTLLIMGGEYHERIDRFRNWKIENKHGSEGEYITLRNYPGQTPTLNVDTWNGLEIISSSYIEVDGLEFRGLPDPMEIIGLPDNHPGRKAAGEVSGSFDMPGDWIAGNGVSVYSNTHHVRIRNCHVHSVGGNGIALGRSHLTRVENNLVWHTSHRGDAGNSGISVAGVSNSPIQPVAYGLVVRNNVVHHIYNRLGFKYYLSGAYLTDGNGIIVDWLSAQEVYPHRTLVANNIVFGCGGRGVHAYESSFVDFVYNTVYKNNRSQAPFSAMVNDGDLSSVGPNRDVNFFNNIGVARDDRRPLRRHGTKILAADEVGLIENNLLNYNASNTEMKPSSTPTGSFDAEENLLNANAGLVNPSLFALEADFRLQMDSDAIGYGSLQPEAVANVAGDMLGRARGAGDQGYDVGALEYGMGPETSIVTVNGGNGSGSHPVGAQVRITAHEPGEGMMFYRWRGDITRLNDVYADQASLLVPSTDVLLTAEYKPYEVASDAVISLAGGVFNQPVPVTLTATQDGSFIYYTTDGTTPGRSNGEIWDNEGGITIFETTTLKVGVWAVGYAESEVRTYHFIFQEINPWYNLEGFNSWKKTGLDWLNDLYFPHGFSLRNNAWITFYPIPQGAYYFYDHGDSSWHYSTHDLEPWGYSFTAGTWIDWSDGVEQ